MIAIPAIDLIDGQVVRLFQGDFSQQTTYTANPVEYALQMENNGLEWLHLVDLSGAKLGKLIHISVLEEITASTNLKVDFGGGVKTMNDVRAILSAGAKQVVVGSLAATDPVLVKSWIEEFGSEQFVIAIDTDGTMVKINGWQDGSGKNLSEVMDVYAEMTGLTILTTDIRRDGTGTGPSVGLYTELIRNYPNQRWIASGGVETITDLQELRAIGCWGCVVGKALLEGKISLETLNAFNDGRL
ncbi:MAG: 1-(5-phosphoribosyl)-5-[(5-phosphoribosylamino)methylideneamino]imidazole-4-carboxamide isomerase [Bacteroidota bacterium]